VEWSEKDDLKIILKRYFWFDHQWSEARKKIIEYMGWDEKITVDEAAKLLKPEDLIEIWNKFTDEYSKSISFFGKFWIVKDGKIKQGDGWEIVRKEIAKILEEGTNAYAILKALLEIGKQTKENYFEFAERIQEISGKSISWKAMQKLEKSGIVHEYRSNKYHDHWIPEEIIPVVREVISKIERKVEYLMDKFKDDPIMLDAIYQWATAPTGITAVRNGFPPNHGLIKTNLKLRYGLGEKEVEEIYEKLKKEIKSIGLDFSSGFLDVENEIKKYFDENDILKNEVVKRLKSASDNEKYIVWLFCKVKDNYWVWTSRINHDYDSYDYEVSKRFEALLNATFNIDATIQEVDSLLIKLGFLNRLEWVGSKSRYGYEKKENHLTFPHYLTSIAENIDDYISLPEPPDFRKFIDALFEKKRVEALIALEELLENGWIKKQEMTGKIIPVPSVVGQKDDVLALNLRIYKQLKEYFFEKKDVELKMINDITRILNLLIERHYPDVSFEEKEPFKAVKVWDVYLMNRQLSEKDIRVIHTPWLTGKQIDMLRDSGKYVVILPTIMGIPQLYNIYRSYFSYSDWIILDATKDKIFERVTNIDNKPKLYEEFVRKLEQKYTVIRRGANPPPETYVSPKKMEKPQKISVEKEIESPQPPPTTSRQLKVYFGKGENKGDIFWIPGELNNGHFIIVGGSGAGKTETIRCIASELNKLSFPVLMIDFHGDMAPSNCEVHTYEIKENGDYYFNPFELNQAFEEITPLRATYDFIEALSINFPTIGPQQKERLKDIIMMTYEKLGITNNPKTWSKELPFERIENEIKNNKDNIKAYLSSLFDFKLFSAKNKISIEDIIKKPKITHIQLRRLPESLRVLYADLLLRKVYYSLQTLGEIPRGDIEDKERFRIFVIVDEAKMLVLEKQGSKAEVKAVLNKYATEMRKFGVGLILASQTIDHFNNEILSNVALKICMKTENKQEAGKNSKFFSTNVESLTKLKTGEGILIMDGKKTKIKITPTWERK